MSLSTHPLPTLYTPPAFNTSHTHTLPSTRLTHRSLSLYPSPLFLVTVSSAEWPAARRTCQLAREALLTAAAALKPGMTTDDIDAVVHTFAVEHEAYPSPLHYRCVLGLCICRGRPRTARSAERQRGLSFTPSTTNVCWGWACASLDTARLLRAQRAGTERCTATCQ